jgi:hypothetical protein
MPKRIRPLPSIDEYFDGLVADLTCKWVKRRAVREEEHIIRDKIFKEIVLRDTDG